MLIDITQEFGGSNIRHKVNEYTRESPKLNAFCTLSKENVFFDKRAVTRIAYLSMLEEFLVSVFKKMLLIACYSNNTVRVYIFTSDRLLKLLVYKEMDWKQRAYLLATFLAWPYSLD